MKRQKRNNELNIGSKGFRETGTERGGKKGVKIKEENEKERK